MSNKSLPDIKTSFSDWYNEIVIQADLIDSSPTRGSFVIRPYGYSLWESIRDILNKEIKATGAQNCYFPMLIPEEFLRREAKHVEGFAPEVAVVTHAGGKKLDKPYVIRPTSETMVYHMFSKWIKSWRDLPLKVNQWANVVRWELRTRPFLRTVEILWQEGHTAHATKEEAVKTSLQMLEVYRILAEDYLAIPVTTGEKSESERFAGADATYTFEGLMQDGKALQMGTSHILSQSFSSAFDVKFQGKDGTMQAPHCTSWGVTTRLIGALVMTHGDQKGLAIPPRIAPIQVVLIPIYRNDEQKQTVLAMVERVKKDLESKNVRLHIDLDEQKSPGAKFYHWEAKGVPIRLEVGPKDVEAGHVALAKRVCADGTKKKFIPVNELPSAVTQELEKIQTDMYQKAVQKKQAQWYAVGKLSEFGKKLEAENGMYQTGWCQVSSCEEQLKEFKGTIRCIISEKKFDTCFACDLPSSNDILVAKAY